MAATPKEQREAVALPQSHLLKYQVFSDDLTTVFSETDVYAPLLRASVTSTHAPNRAQGAIFEVIPAGPSRPPRDGGALRR